MKHSTKWMIFALACSLGLGGVTLYRAANKTAKRQIAPSVAGTQMPLSQFTKDDLNIMKPELRRDGATLLFVPREDVPPWALELPLNWNADPFGDRNWQFQLHAWRMMDPLLYEFSRSGDKELLREAFKYAMDWFSFHYERHQKSQMEWYDMAAGLRAMRLAFFVEQYHNGNLDIGKDDARRLMTLVEEHSRRLQDKKFIARNNHGLFQVFGLNLLCMAAADQDSCHAGRKFASQMFSLILKGQFTDEGVHIENSPDYHQFVRSTIKLLGGAERFNDKQTSELLAKAEAVEPWFIDPAGNFVPIGDTSGQEYFKPLVSEANSPPTVGDFTRSGYGIVRDHDSMLFVMGMSHKMTHKHADDLSFTLFEHGRRIFIDSGKYGYNNDPFREYVLSGAAHNTVSLLDQTIRPKDVVLSGSALDPILSEKDGFTITGRVERPGIFKQSREIRYRPGHSLHIRDELSSEREQQFVSSLHLARDLTPEMVEGGFDIALPEGTRIKARLSEADCKIDMVRGQKDPLLGWEAVGYLKMEPTSVVRAICPGRNRTITWTIALR